MYAHIKINSTITKRQIFEKKNIFKSFIKSFFFQNILFRRPHNPADVYYRQTRPDIYNNIGMVNENGEKWKEMRSQVFHSFYLSKIQRHI